MGVSHLVQATRAGADYGMGLTLIIIIACIIKYPSLRFGGDYAAATGTSLITSYKAEGWWAFGIYAIAQLLSMVFVVAALSLFTLGLFQAALGFEINTLVGVSILLTGIIGLLVKGHYHLLERVTKYIVATLTVLIVIATFMVAVKIDWTMTLFTVPTITGSMILYLIPIIGFMPTPTDGSILQSLWTCAKAEDIKRRQTTSEAQFDFNLGYITSVILALCFLTLGTGVMYNSGVQIETSSSGFSGQLIQLFTKSIGAWSFPLISIAVIFVMLSTLMTVVDGMTRIVVGIINVSKSEVTTPQQKTLNNTKLYNIIIIVLCTTSVLVLATMMKSFAAFIDITTTIAFIISPLLAFLNHRAMWSDRVHETNRPGQIMKVWSLTSMSLLLALTLGYFYFQFSH